MAQKKKTKEEIEREISIGRVAVEFARLVCLAKPADLVPFHVEESYMQPDLWGKEHEARAVILRGVVVSPARFAGGIIAFDEPVSGCAPCVWMHELSQFVTHWREAPYGHPPDWFGIRRVDAAMYGALLRAFSRLDDQMAELQDAGEWPRPKAAS